MHEGLLAQAALPAPTVCLGLLLRPYSLGHELLLFRNESPFVTRARPSQLEDLIAAAMICFQTWEENQRMYQDRLLRFKTWLWRRRISKMAWQLDLAAFNAYRADGCLEFPLSEIGRPDRGPSPRTPGAPFILRLQQWLMRTLNLTEPAAWDYPLGLATMRWECHWEQEGGLDIYNWSESEHDRAVAEEMERQKKEATCPA
jgi:hypothetical protein